MSLWSQTVEVARVDLAVETRIGDTYRIVLPFGVVALMVFSLAMVDDPVTVSNVGIAVFWSIAILYGVQVALRTSVTETMQRRDMSILLGLDPAARFLGRSMASGAILTGFMLLLFGATLVLFDPELGSGWVPAAAISLPLGAGGLAMLATLAGEVASGLRNRTALASLIVAPLAIPLVVGATQSLQAINRGGSILTWTLLLVTTDLILFTAGVGLSRPLEEASR
jgi:heme exporter protein B